MNDKISIVIPAYNIAKELPACLDSILAQSYKNIEIVIVNDGSKDETATVMEQYAALDPRIKPIHKENGGVTSARLRGVREAGGDWIGFVDGDDIIEANMYELLFNNAQKYNADISHCGYQMVFPSRVDYYYNTGRVVEQTHDSGLEDLIRADFVEPALVNKLYRRALFRKILSDSVMDSSIKNFEDLLMNFYLFDASEKAVFEDRCLYHYTLRAGSAATSKINEHKLLDPLKVMKCLLCEVQEGSKLYGLLQIRLARLLISLSTMSAKGNPDLIRPHRKTARRELRAMLPELRKSPYCSKKMYLMGVWAGCLPHTYQAIHWLHGKITGNDKKYEVK